MDVTVEGLCNLLARSRLLSADEVRALRIRWMKEAGASSSDAGRFTKWLTSNQFITEYQAGLLHRGLVDNFFLGDFKILDRIGKGRMAGVYKAAHKLGQTVAIKVLPPSKAKEPESLARFQREARLALKLKHPNVVRTLNIGDVDGLHYIVMEYLDGETLEDVIERRGKLPVAEAARIMHQALLGLQHIHEQDMVHRDLKPANLMLVPTGEPSEGDTTFNNQVKILDIGLGRALFDENAKGPAGDLTTFGELLGTPAYMSPEQGRNAHAADIRSDIYTLGCVLYHALAGQPPFVEKNLVRLMIRHSTEMPRPLVEFNPAIPDGLQQVVNWMLAKDPAQRYPTPQRAAQALQVFLTDQEEAPAQTVKAFVGKQDSGRKLGRGDPGLAFAKSGSPEPSPFVPQPVPAAAPPPRPAPAPAKAPAAVAPSPRQAERPTPIPTDTEPQEFDVELVPVRQKPKILEPLGDLLNLSRRDWIMVGAGALLLLIAEGFGLFMANLLRRKAKTEPTPQPEGDKPEEPEG
jgi:serine/threonine protein kinase